MPVRMSKAGVELSYPGHHKVANLHLLPRLVKALPEQGLSVIPLTAAAQAHCIRLWGHMH